MIGSAFSSGAFASGAFAPSAFPFSFGASGYPPLDLSGLNVLARFDLADASSVWSDTSRTTPATIGGNLRGLTDLSGNGNHGTFADNAIWSGVHAICPDEVVGSHLLSIPSLSWSTQDVAVIYLIEPMTLSSSSSICYFVTHATADTHIVWHQMSPSNGGFQWNGSATPIGLPLGRHAVTLRLGASSRKAFVDASNSNLASAFGATSYTGLYLGSPTDINACIHGFNLRSVIVTDAVTATDLRIAQLHTDLKTQWENVDPVTTTNIVVVGDSLTVGHGSENNPYWRQILVNNLSVRFWACSISGLPTGGGVPVPVPEPQMDADHVLYWLGTNDLNTARTLGQIQTDIAAYLTALGSTPFSILTIAPRSGLSGAQETMRNDVNDWIRSTYPDDFVDLDEVGLVTGSADYYDAVHLTAQGQAKVAGAVATHLGLSL